MPRGPHTEDTRRRHRANRRQFVQKVETLLEAGMDRREIADHIDMSPSQINAYVQGKRCYMTGGEKTAARMEILDMLIAGATASDEARPEQVPMDLSAVTPIQITSVERRRGSPQKEEQVAMADLFSGFLIGALVGGSTVFIALSAWEHFL